MSDDNVVSFEKKKNEKIEEETVAPFNDEDYERYSIIQGGLFVILMRFQQEGYFPAIEDIDSDTFAYDFFFAVLAVASVIARTHGIETEIQGYAEDILHIERPESFREVFQKYHDSIWGPDMFDPSNDG